MTIILKLIWFLHFIMHCDSDSVVSLNLDFQTAF